jgi:uncharacterized protein YndB with AHSA1/START domain
MHIERSIDIAAPPALVWSIFIDVERWHEWTASITSVTRLDQGPLAVGSRARVLQPLIRPAVFEVTEFTPGRSFAWSTSNGGVRALANHVVEPAPGGTRATISLDFQGFPLVFLGWWVRWLTDRYFTMETEGLKRRAEEQGGAGR